MQRPIGADAALTEAVRVEIIRLLIAAYSAGHERESALLSDALLTMLPTDLPEELLQNKSFAMKLVQQDGLWLRRLTAFFGDEDVVALAIKQNGWALWYADLSLRKNKEFIQDALGYLNQLIGSSFEYDEETAQDFNGIVLLFVSKCLSSLPQALLTRFSWPVQGEPALSEIQKIHAVHLLFSPGRVRAATVSKLARLLTPQEMVEVVYAREEMSLLPLPYCHDSARFEEFAYGETCPTTDWYQAFVREQHPDLIGFEYLSDCFEALQLILQTLIDGVVSATLALAYAGAVIGIFLASVISAIFLADFLLDACFLPIINYFLPFLPLGLGVLAAFIVMIVWELVVISLFYLMLIPVALILDPRTSCFSYDCFFYHVDCFFTGLNSLLETSASFLKQLYVTCFAARDVQPEDALVTRCEKSIDRLLFVLKDESAHEKGALLNQIWDKIRQEGGNDDEAALQSRLTTPYEVLYHGDSRSLSFFEVAATKRTPSQPFELDAPRSCFRFFSDRFPSTTCEGLGALSVSPMI